MKRLYLRLMALWADYGVLFWRQVDAASAAQALTDAEKEYKRALAHDELCKAALKKAERAFSLAHKRIERHDRLAGFGIKA